MSEPPKDDGTPLTHIISEISKGLDEASFVEDDIRGDLLEGIQDSLRALFGTAFVHAEPNVQVVEGGRSDDSPPTPGLRPTLKVAERDDYIEDTEITELDSSLNPNISVRLFKHDLSSITPRAPLTTGTICLKEGESEQCIYVGRSVRLYRIVAITGALTLNVDGNMIGSLQEGQSMDIEGAQIKVMADASQDSHGSFALLVDQ